MSFDYAGWQEDHAANDCLSENEAEALVICQECGHNRESHSEEMPYDCCDGDCDCRGFSYVSAERERIKERCAVALVRLGITPMSFITQRIVRGK